MGKYYFKVCTKCYLISTKDKHICQSCGGNDFTSIENDEDVGTKFTVVDDSHGSKLSLESIHKLFGERYSSVELSSKKAEEVDKSNESSEEVNIENNLEEKVEIGGEEIVIEKKFKKKK
jgi:hypothetical protein